MISDIVPHEPLLVIEQPTDTAKRCDVTTSVGLGGGVRKKICMKRWGCIDTFHVIESSLIDTISFLSKNEFGPRLFHLDLKEIFDQTVY